MRRGILSSMPDDDYLSIALLHLPFNVYATICRATDRQGFLNVRDDSRSFGVDKVSTDGAGFASALYGSVDLGPWCIPCARSARLAFLAHAVCFFIDPSFNLQCTPCLLSV
jgi:hypothetical protein